MKNKDFNPLKQIEDELKIMFPTQNKIVLQEKKKYEDLSNFEKKQYLLELIKELKKKF